MIERKQLYYIFWQIWPFYKLWKRVLFRAHKFLKKIWNEQIEKEIKLPRMSLQAAKTPDPTQGSGNSICIQILAYTWLVLMLIKLLSGRTTDIYSDRDDIMAKEESVVDLNSTFDFKKLPYGRLNKTNVCTHIGTINCLSTKVESSFRWKAFVLNFKKCSN